MADNDITPRPGRLRDTGRTRQPSLKQQIFRQAGSTGLAATWSKGHIKPGAMKRGMGTGMRAAAGLIAPGGRRVIVKARYTTISGRDLGAARAHLKYIQRDGVTRDGEAGQLYDANGSEADASAFLDRSETDPHQFRFIVSADDSSSLPDLKPFIRDLMLQMERDLDSKLDWVAVDHFNTGHPHTHIVIRGRDDRGEDLVMARSYIGHGVRARAQGLVTMQLGHESDLERLRKLTNEVAQERLTSLDRSLLLRVKDGVLTLPAAPDAHPALRSLRIGRLQTLQRLGLAEERQKGVWQLDAAAESKLRQLGERADKFKMMQRALKDVGIDRAASALALFEKAPRKAPLIGKVVGVGMVDEITDRTWVVLDAVDGRVHYAELGRLQPGSVPARGMIAALGGGLVNEKPNALPRLHVLSPVPVERLASYEGPTWLDEAIIAKWRPDPAISGASAELHSSIEARADWLAARQLAVVRTPDGITPSPSMMAALRKIQTERLVATLSQQLNAEYIPSEPGRRISGTYVRSLNTPTGKIAVIQRQDTFTLAPWKPALEPLRGLQVIGSNGPNRVYWTLDRGRTLPPRV